MGERLQGHRTSCVFARLVPVVSTSVDRSPTVESHDSPSDSRWARPHTRSPTIRPSEAEQATSDSLTTEPARLLAFRFGEELRRRRRDAGLHQQELADRIAYHRSYLSQVERGR